MNISQLILHEIKNNIDFYNGLQDILLLNRPLSFIILFILLNYLIFMFFKIHQSFYLTFLFYSIIILNYLKVFNYLKFYLLNFIINDPFPNKNNILIEKFEPKKLAAFIGTIIYIFEKFYNLFF